MAMRFYTALQKTWIYLTPYVCTERFALIEVGSSHLCASFGTFCVQIGQLVEAEWDFKLLEEFEIDNSDFTVFKHFSKTHCDSKIWRIVTQKVPKEE